MVRAVIARSARVSTIPPGVPFVDSLALGLRERFGSTPDALVHLTLLLPTRRACLALRDAFLRHSDGAALLLPRLMPLGDMDAEEIEPGAGESLPESLTAELAEPLPAAISGLERQLTLARLILARAEAEGAPRRPDQAARLAAELARLLDQTQTEQLSFDGLKGLVPEDYAAHWQATLEFLDIVTSAWPAILAERGLIDPATRRNRVLAAVAARWQAAPPQHPVIAAGSTGSIPATAALLAVICHLPEGEVVLPGLDQQSDEAIWREIDESHPQYGLKRLLERLEVERDQVTLWGDGQDDDSRARLLNTALRPAAATSSWAAEPPPPAPAFDGIEIVECPGPREEAGVIALRLRAALETPGRSAALVTRDRALARRVAAELGRWGIAVDDSGGRPLVHTACGGFLGLTAALVAEDAAPLALLAALKHPLAAAGIGTAACRAKLRLLEREVLRKRQPGRGFAAMIAALGAHEAELGPWLKAIAAMAAPFAEALAAAQISLAALAAAHLAFAEALATSDMEANGMDDGAERLWRGDDGEAAAAFFAELIEAAEAMPPLAGRDYPALLDSLIEGRVVRPRHGGHPRLHIWGPLEARLQHADEMILGGLNEGSWPPDAASDPWLSRPMRSRFGLPAPERRIGLSAHDFVQFAAAPRVLLSRAAKVEGTPTAPSRWLARLDNLLQGWDRADALNAGPDVQAWPERLDRPDTVRALEPPAPTPPVTARPRRLSVTRIETWRRDPYAIYARYILDLRALDAIDAEPTAADRGTIIHQALEDFVAAYPQAGLPDNALEALIEIGHKVFAPYMDRPGVCAFWWPRFERIAAWFITTEQARRGDLAVIHSEAVGHLVLPAPAGDFTLTAKADRIEQRHDGGLAVIDYKTGSVPTKADILAGFAPQLSLEAAIAQAGGFDRIPAGDVEE
ncbi:MAG: double-strand break repair protein AddB, partial [Alphaproteobacteria bacterium]